MVFQRWKMAGNKQWGVGTGAGRHREKVSDLGTALGFCAMHIHFSWSSQHSKVYAYMFTYYMHILAAKTPA